MKRPKVPAAHPLRPLYAETNIFIVRIWQEHTGNPGEGGVWRGFITHVDNNRRQYFFDLGGITHFIQEQTGIRNPSRPSWWRFLFYWLRHEKKQT